MRFSYAMKSDIFYLLLICFPSLSFLPSFLLPSVPSFFIVFSI